MVCLSLWYIHRDMFSYHYYGFHFLRDKKWDTQPIGHMTNIYWETLRNQMKIWSFVIEQ